MNIKFPRLKSCTSKQTYSTYKMAEKALSNLVKHEVDRVGLHIYTCRYCHNFHIGHGLIDKRNWRRKDVQTRN